VERPSRLPLYIGIVLLVLGWAVLFIGWYQAGRQDLETGQIPYVISGGFGGFGLILMGIIAILMDVVRQAEASLRRSAEELHVRMEDLAEIFVHQQTESRPVDRPQTASRRRSRPRG
jgi:hypothetical protein